MGWRNKVVWSEGMLLQPQHFQQHDRWTDHTLNGRFGALNACGWGLRRSNSMAPPCCWARWR